MIKYILLYGWAAIMVAAPFPIFWAMFYYGPFPDQYTMGLIFLSWCLWLAFGAFGAIVIYIAFAISALK